MRALETAEEFPNTLHFTLFFGGIIVFLLVVLLVYVMQLVSGVPVMLTELKTLLSRHKRRKEVNYEPDDDEDVEAQYASPRLRRRGHKEPKHAPPVPTVEFPPAHVHTPAPVVPEPVRPVTPPVVAPKPIVKPVAPMRDFDLGMYVPSYMQE